MITKLKWVLSILWRVPVTLLLAIIGYAIFTGVLVKVRDGVSNEWYTVNKLAELVEQYDSYVSTNSNAGLQIQTIDLSNDEYLVFNEGTKNERYVFTLNLPNDSHISTRELHSKTIPTDFEKVPLYRLKEDPSIYAIDPRVQYEEFKDVGSYIVNFIFSFFGIIMGVVFFMRMGVWVWEKHQPLEYSAQQKLKTAAPASAQESTNNTIKFGWGIWLVWASLLVLLPVTVVVGDWVEMPMTQTEWEDLLFYSVFVACTSFMVVFVIEIFSARHRAQNGLPQSRHLLFFPSLVLFTVLLVPAISWMRYQFV